MKETIQNIRKDCRQAMNGIVSTSMREHGLDYKLNFGLVALQIKALAEKYGSSAPLAEELWKENTRELKILSTLIYPVEEFGKETANRWVKEIANQEIREQICINLFQNLPYAAELAKEWTADSDDEIRITGYWLLTRLMTAQKQEAAISIHDLEEYIWNDVVSVNMFLRNSATFVLKRMVRNSKDQADYILSRVQPFRGSPDLLKAEAYDGIAFEIEFMYS